MPAAEVVATIGAIGAATKGLAAAFQTLQAKGLKGAEGKKAISEAQDLVITLQSRVLDLQQTVLGLQAENAELREEIRSHESRAAKQDRYELRQVGQSHVYSPKGEDGPYLCPTCFDSSGLMSHLSPLPRQMRTLGSHTCPKCNGRYRLT